MNNERNSTRQYRRGICLVMVILLICMTACGGNDKEEPLRATEEKTVTTVAIETMYGALQFPEELFANLRHVEATEGRIAMEVFYMVSEDGEKELYRIHFADAKMGTHMGYLTIDEAEIPISYSVCEYEDQDFKSEDEKKLYYSMMDAFSVIVNAIHDDVRFSEARTVEPVASGEVKLRYWKVTLPENVMFAETDEKDGTYRVNFFGEVGGERINLYMIAIGNVEAETMLGWYTINGEQKPVMVQTHSTDVYESWSEEDRVVIYNMMSSLNVVIQTIVEDENFSTLEAGI